MDGEYHYDHKHSVLEWQLPVIDSSNKSGSMEFSIAGHPGDFFPVSVTFTSRKSYCDLKVFSVFCNSMPKKSHTYKLSCNSTDIYLNVPTQTCIGVFLIVLWYCSTRIFFVRCSIEFT